MFNVIKEEIDRKIGLLAKYYNECCTLDIFHVFQRFSLKLESSYCVYNCSISSPINTSNFRKIRSRKENEASSDGT